MLQDHMAFGSLAKRFAQEKTDHIARGFEAVDVAAAMKEPEQVVSKCIDCALAHLPSCYQGAHPRTIEYRGRYGEGALLRRQYLDVRGHVRRELVVQRHVPLFRAVE
jgi:hypothetical protein